MNRNKFDEVYHLIMNDIKIISLSEDRDEELIKNALSIGASNVKNKEEILNIPNHIL